MLDITKLTDNELAELSANLLALLAGTELLAIDPHLRAELVAAYGTKPSDFAAEISAAAEAEDKRKAAVSEKNKTRSELVFVGRRARSAMKAYAAPKSQYEIARIHFRKAQVSMYVASDPTDVTAIGFSNGINVVRFRGNNRTQSIIYEIWRREGKDGQWRPHTITKRQKFKDEHVVPGRYYEYRVRAAAAKNKSDFSNVAVVYGVL